MIYQDRRYTSAGMTQWDGSLCADPAQPVDWLWSKEELQMLSTPQTEESSMNKFSHFRDIDKRGNVNPRGGATVAYRTEGKYTYAAVSFCNPIDNFNFQYGRNKSNGRLTQLLARREIADDQTYFIFNSDKGLTPVADYLGALGYRRRGPRA